MIRGRKFVFYEVSQKSCGKYVKGVIRQDYSLFNFSELVEQTRASFRVAERDEAIYRIAIRRQSILLDQVTRGA